MERAFEKYVILVETVGEPYELKKRFRYDEVASLPEWRYLRAESGSFHERSMRSWLQLLLYLSIFYCGIVIFWHALFSVFEKLLSEDEPMYLSWQPGICYAPRIIASSSSINYQVHDSAQVDAHVGCIKRFLQKFGNRTDFGNCTAATKYGYGNGTPCIFLKINRIIGFRTKPFESLENMPVFLPDELRAHISLQDEANRKGRVWISCETSDKAVQFYYTPAERAVLTKYVDTPKRIQHGQTDNENARFYNDDDYQRIVAVQLTNVAPNVKTIVRCHMWAKNIKIAIPYEHGFGSLQILLTVRQ